MELEAHLRGLPSGAVEALRACVENIERGWLPVGLSVSTPIRSTPDGPELTVQIRPASEQP